MKIVALVITLLFVISGCGNQDQGKGRSQKSKWIAVDLPDASAMGFSVYTNASDMQRSGAKTTLWQLVDYSTPQVLGGDNLGEKTAYLSVKNEIKYDCQNKEHATIYSIYFAKNMGEGRIIYLDSSDGTELLALDRFGSMRSFEYFKTKVFDLNGKGYLSRTFPNSERFTAVSTTPNSFGEMRWRDACGK